MGNGYKDGGGSGDQVTRDGSETTGGESYKPKLLMMTADEDGGRTEEDCWNCCPVRICWACDADVPVTASKADANFYIARGRHIPGAAAPPEGGDNRPCC